MLKRTNSVFFGGKEKLKDSPVQKMATDLGNALRRNRLATKGVDNGYQCHLLYELVRKHPAREVKLVLDWFIDNCKNPVLKVSSIQGFVKKYPLIKSWYDKACSKETFITKEAEEIAEEADQYSWPMGCEEQIPEFVQMCLDNLKTFFVKVKEKTDWKKPERVKIPKEYRGLFEYTSENWYEIGIGFLSDWMQWVNEVITKWSDWDGNLKPLVWRPDHWLFTKKGRQWTDEYGLPAPYWNKLIEELNK